jgi:hypothetical protein
VILLFEEGPKPHDQILPFSKVKDLTAHHMLHLATPLQVALAQVFLPHADGEQMGMRLSRLVCHIR